MSFMPPTDSMFLLGETREHPMHVGSLQLFVPPDGAGPEWARSMLDTIRADDDDIAALFRKRPATPVNSLGNTWWKVDDDVDLDYHVRHSAVPSPARIRELLQLTSRWHGTSLDRHRPMWEMHIIEGLADGRVAVYTKVHHSLIDGVSAMRVLLNALSSNPDDLGCPSPLRARLGRGEASKGRGFDPLALLRSGTGIAGQMLGLAPASLKIANQIVRDGDITLPRAPKTMLNGRIGGARRFAAQSWEIERVQHIAKASDTTMNDVVLAMCSGALRGYLLEQDALPDEPMSAMVPVSLALAGGPADEGGGNAVGAIIVNLATDKADGATRLEEIHHSASQAKRVYGDLTPLQILALSAVQLLPLALTPLPGFVDMTRPPFNVIISNVPGPTEEMYWNGARLDGMYPASIALDGQALNITLTSRKGFIDFGIVGCRRSVPHLQRLLTHLDATLLELEKAWV